MCLNIHIDFHHEETQIQSAICDINSEIKSSEEVKDAHYEIKSDDLNEEKIELDRESNIVKCKHQINIFILIEWSWPFLILFMLWSLASNILTVRFQTKE